MKRIWIMAAFAIALTGCGNGGNATNETEDTTSPASGATGMGAGTGSDTTGLDVGAVQPTDGNTPMRDTTDVPGADKSTLKDSNSSTNGGTGGGSQ